MKNKPRLIVIGSSNTDMVASLPKLPGPGETVVGGSFQMAAGGKGANQAVAAARAGGRVTFVACVGGDVFGANAVAGFKKEGIDVSQIRREPKLSSGVALIFVGQNGENSIGVAGGSNEALKPAHIRALKPSFKPGVSVVMQLETPLPTVQLAAQLARKQGATVILNPAPARELPDELLRNVDILTPNEHEAAQLTGLPVKDVESARTAARKLRERGAKIVIITLGSAGAFLSCEETEMHVPGFKVKAVDTVAAGDVFNGALAVARAEGNDWAQALRFAHAAAAISVTRPGAQPSVPTRREIEAFLRKQK